MTPEDIVRRTPEAMIRDFNALFYNMADTFMEDWGDYIGDADQVAALLENAFDNWVSDSDLFE